MFILLNKLKTTFLKPSIIPVELFSQLLIDSGESNFYSDKEQIRFKTAATDSHKNLFRHQLFVLVDNIHTFVDLNILNH